MQAKSLGNLEQQVMEIVWQCKVCTVREVLGRINKTHQIAYTTVATILQRLYQKGLVSKKQQGAAYLYSPKLTKASYTKKIAQLFLEKFVHSFGNVAIASFAESIETLPEEKRRYFLMLLEKHGKSE